jgi:outer membrane protein assembly factor BamB
MNKMICIVGVLMYFGTLLPPKGSHGENTSTNANVPFVWGTLGGNFKHTGLSTLDGPTSGYLRWTFKTDAPVQTSVTLDAQGRIYVACMDGKLYCLETDGSTDWFYDANSPLTTSPTIAKDGTLLVGSQSGMLHAVDSTGAAKWIYQTEGPIYSCPAIHAE